MARPNKYKSDEERHEARLESKRRYRKNHPDLVSAYNKKYYESHKKKINELNDIDAVSLYPHKLISTMKSKNKSI